VNLLLTTTINTRYQSYDNVQTIIVAVVELSIDLAVSGLNLIGHWR
jgi:hypothetical protein